MSLWSEAYTDPMPQPIWRIWRAWRAEFGKRPLAAGVRRLVRLDVKLAEHLAPSRGTVALIEACLREHGEDRVLDALEAAVVVDGPTTCITLPRILLAALPVRDVEDDCGAVAEWRLPLAVTSGGPLAVDLPVTWCDGLRHYRRSHGGDYPRWVRQCPAAVRAQREAAPQPADAVQTLDSYRPQPHTQEAHAAACAFLSGPARVLVIVGPHGRGKTHLGRGVLTAATARGLRTHARTGEELKRLAYRVVQYGEAGSEANEATEEMVAVDVLLLDDLGKGGAPSHGLVHDLLSRRQGRTVVTIQTEEWRGLPEAMKSRLSEQAVHVEIVGGEDYRRRVA